MGVVVSEAGDLRHAAATAPVSVSPRLSQPGWQQARLKLWSGAGGQWPCQRASGCSLGFEDHHPRMDLHAEDSATRSALCINPARWSPRTAHAPWRGPAPGTSLHCVGLGCGWLHGSSRRESATLPRTNCKQCAPTLSSDSKCRWSCKRMNAQSFVNRFVRSPPSAGPGLWIVSPVRSVSVSVSVSERARAKMRVAVRQGEHNGWWRTCGQLTCTRPTRPDVDDLQKSVSSLPYPPPASL